MGGAPCVCVLIDPTWAGSVSLRASVPEKVSRGNDLSASTHLL